ncbi:uncharacterized protein EV422DRAFT_547059 [Fimicolochytrium jonesii]|uniref:uncharacterized protein n=1 Tax=Fimicolochytrium jonesii TaxID=1396493 RepID=UPI0022FF39BF|nr:uncharacterized protein EV422DRAFT_547059 [Fimicolochytrium jonesii]KAI8816187.1 hypothetical protein EV422DRAFT_547059 [Fimicolochytrium jonesii]
MAIARRAIVVGPGCSMCCTVLSAIGIIFLFLLGALFHAHAEELVEGKEGEVPTDPAAVARGCYLAGFIYMGFFGFCWGQVGLVNQLFG